MVLEVISALILVLQLKSSSLMYLVPGSGFRFGQGAGLKIATLRSLYSYVGWSDLNFNAWAFWGLSTSP